MDALEAARQRAARDVASRRMQANATRSPRPAAKAAPRTGSSGWMPAVRTAQDAAGTAGASHDTGSVHVPTAATPLDTSQAKPRTARRSFGVGMGDQ